MDSLEKIAGGPSSRRGFLAAVGAAGIGLAAAPLFAGNGLTPTPTAKPPAGGGVPTDGASQFSGFPGSNINVKILNFALTLEFLEADLYRQALNLASGLALTTALSSNSGSYTRKVSGGGLSPVLTDVGFRYLRDFAYVEAAHREYLLGVIKSLNETAVAANPKGYNFGGAVSANMAGILGAILPLEETGVRAYLGALPYFDSLAFGQAAASIYSTEARHSAAINYTLGIDPGPYKKSGDIAVAAGQPSQNTFEYYLKPQTVVAAVTPLFNK